MANQKSPMDSVPGSINRGAVLGLVVFGLFVVVGGVIWAVGSALGLGTAPAFFLAACSAPLLVAGVVLVWLFSLPQARRQAMLGVGPRHPVDEPSPPEDANPSDALR